MEAIGAGRDVVLLLTATAAAGVILDDAPLMRLPLRYLDINEYELVSICSHECLEKQRRKIKTYDGR